MKAFGGLGIFSLGGSGLPLMFARTGEFGPVEGSLLIPFIPFSAKR